AGYAAFDGELPALTEQSAVAAQYAHVTAPMRRLVDRYANEACIALCANLPVPDWVRAALPTLPDTLRDSDRTAHQYERAIIALAEAVILAPRVGESFAGSIVEVLHGARDGGGAAHTGIVMLRDPPLEARVESDAPLELGADVSVRLAQADPGTRTVRFVMV
ncbi:MAG: RNB domain-containing ribonuclease, partial [Proteobacteria bacterium]|nr:RNB domain-containing ribonuclease [Pseudomonadota bacterium]